MDKVAPVTGEKRCGESSIIILEICRTSVDAGRATKIGVIKRRMGRGRIDDGRRERWSGRWKWC